MDGRSPSRLRRATSLWSRVADPHMGGLKRADVPPTQSLRLTVTSPFTGGS